MTAPERRSPAAHIPECNPLCDGDDHYLLGNEANDILTAADEPGTGLSEEERIVEPCPRRQCRGRVPHSRLIHWLGWMRR